MNKEFLEKLTILYVEDQEEIKNFTSEILKSFVKEVFVANNGLEGLEIFKNNKESIDVVITDINMPKLDGLAMVKEINNICNRDVPVIITTAHTDQKFFRESINLNIHSYTLKPIDLYDLVKNIIKSLETTFLKKEIEKQKLNFSNKEEIIELLNKQDSLMAVFEKDDLLYSNTNFEKTFKGNFSFENFIQDDIYFSKVNVPQNISWYEYINSLNELNRVSKILIEDEVNIFKLETIFLNEEKDKFILSLYNVTKLNEKSNLFDYNAHHDNITGLYNKNKFHKLFNVETKRARRYRKDLSFIIFEFTNDLYTHESVFDKVLVMMADKVSNNIREHDINFKWEESSFLVMLPETDLDGALNVAYKLEETLNDLMKKNKLTNEFSFGISSLDTTDEEKDIISKLSNALKISKESKENRVNYY